MAAAAHRLLAAGVSLALAQVLVPAAAAGAREVNPRTALVITVSEEGEKPVMRSLRCNPPQGTHPYRAQACRELAAAEGKLRELPGRDPQAPCTKIYRPVIAEADGATHGRAVDYRKTFGNRCEMLQATGVLFDLTD